MSECHFKQVLTASRFLVLALSLALVAVPGCFLVQRNRAPQRAPHPQAVAPRPQPKQVDPKAQQHYYDIGLQRYSKENYSAAKEAFQKAIEFGPNTPLAGKAQENIRKIDRILKTLQEIEAK